MASNEEWNRALCDYFFTSDSRDQPVYLSVDDDALGRVAASKGWSLEDPVKDFTRAVRSWCDRRSPFLDPYMAMLRWRRDGCAGDPPFVTALALTVLAATRMGSTRHARGRYSYYRPLGDLLGSEETTQPRDYDVHVPAMWRELENWLRSVHSGRRGLSTAVAPKDGAYCYIGWSVSQAVVRGSDRAAFAQFFTSVGARPGEDVPAPDLMAHFCRWALSGRGRVSERVASALRDEDLREVLAQALRAELLRWDGSTHGGLHSSLPVYLTARLGLRKSVGLLTRATPRVHGVTLLTGSDRVRLGDPGEWAELPLTAHPAAFHGGSPPECQLDDGRLLRLSVPREDCYVLTPEETLGRYVSISASELGVEHCVLARSAVAPAVEAAMSAAGQPGRRVVMPGLPSEWVCWRGYVPQRRVEVPPQLASLAPGTAMFATLSGGLPLDSGSRVYLVGGSPDVVVPAGQPDPVTIALNGRELARIGREGGMLSLADKAGVGTHEVQVAHRRLRFTVVDRLLQGAGARPARRLDHAPLSARLQVRKAQRFLALSDGPDHAQVFPADPEWMVVAGLPPHLAELSSSLALLPFRSRWLVRLSRASQEAQVLEVPAALKPDATPPYRAPVVVSDPVSFQALLRQVAALHVTVGRGDPEQWREWLEERLS